MGMNRIALAALAVACLSGPALAADLPVKAAPLSNIFGPYTGYGLYVGFNAGGGGGNANLANANVVSLQGLVGLTVGYAWSLPSGQSFLAIEGDFDLMNLNTGANAGLTLNGPADLEQRVLYGFPLQTAAQFVPFLGNLLSNNPLPPFNALPAGVTAGNSHLYLFAGVDEKDVSTNVGLTANKAWLIAPEVGFGNRVQLSNGFAMDQSLAVQFDEKGQCVGVASGQMCGNLGTNYIAKIKFLY